MDLHICSDTYKSWIARKVLEGLGKKCVRIVNPYISIKESYKFSARDGSASISTLRDGLSNFTVMKYNSVSVLVRNFQSAIFAVSIGNYNFVICRVKYSKSFECALQSGLFV